MQAGLDLVLPPRTLESLGPQGAPLLPTYKPFQIAHVRLSKVAEAPCSWAAGQLVWEPRLAATGSRRPMRQLGGEVAAAATIWVGKEPRESGCQSCVVSEYSHAPLSKAQPAMEPVYSGGLTRL